MALKKVFTVGLNEDLEFSARWTDEVGNPYQLQAAYCQVRRDGLAEPLLDLSVGSGITLDPVDGWATVYVPAASLTEIEPGFSDFDLLLVRDDGRRYRPIVGSVNFEEAVTVV